MFLHNAIERVGYSANFKAVLFYCKAVWWVTFLVITPLLSRCLSVTYAGGSRPA